MGPFPIIDTAIFWKSIWSKLFLTCRIWKWGVWKFFKIIKTHPNFYQRLIIGNFHGIHNLFWGKILTPSSGYANNIGIWQCFWSHPRAGMFYKPQVQMAFSWKEWAIFAYLNSWKPDLTLFIFLYRRWLIRKF